MYIICICIYLNIYLNEFPRLESDLPEQAGALVAALVVEALQLLESGFLGLVALDKLCLKTPIALWLSKPIWTPESKLAWFNTVASCCFWRLYHIRKVCFQHTWCLILAWVRNPNLDAMKTWWKRDALSKDRLQLWVEFVRLLHSTRHFGGQEVGRSLWSSSKVQKLSKLSLFCSRLLWLWAWRGHHSIGPCLCGNCRWGGTDVRKTCDLLES